MIMQFSLQGAEIHTLKTPRHAEGFLECHSLNVEAAQGEES